MQRAQRLLKCERAAVLLVDESCDSTRFSKLFDLNSPKHNTKNNVKKSVRVGQTAVLLLLSLIVISLSLTLSPTIIIICFRPGLTCNVRACVSVTNSSRQKVEGENVSRYLESLAERVACSGEVLNINEHECNDGIVDSGINSLLAMPIRNKNDQIIGTRARFSLKYGTSGGRGGRLPRSSRVVSVGFMCDSSGPVKGLISKLTL